MNSEWAKNELEKFIGMTVMHTASSGNFFTFKNTTSASSDEVAKQAQVVEKILELALEI